MQSQKQQKISIHFQGKPFNITVIQVYGPTSNAEETEVKQFYEDLQDLLKVIPKKDVLFIIGDWNAKLGSQETPGITGKFGPGIQKSEVFDRIIYQIPEPESFKQRKEFLTIFINLFNPICELVRHS